MTLGVDHLDVFILHRDDPSMPVSVFADALREQIAAGTITSFGVSNWTLERLEALRAELGADAHQLSVFSNHFSLVKMIAPTRPGCRSMTKSDISWLETHGVTPLAWAIFAGGYLAGRDTPSWVSPDNEGRRARAMELASARKTALPVVAAAYVLAQAPHMLGALGTTTLGHLEQLMGAAAMRLTDDELYWLESGAER
jgi:aryl-alcohol dehydrogenase-like predicted oxidoreductase